MNEADLAPDGVDVDEWQVRCELASLYRLLAHYRMTDLIYTHVSARIPGPEHHFLINRYGRLFSEMRASDLVKIDIEGNVLDDLPQGSVNKAGFVIHSAIHMAREDLLCVIHTHTAAGIAVAAQREGLMPLSQHALKFYGHLAYHRYEGVALDLDERKRLVADLGQYRAMILRNHGLLVGGRSIAEAFDHIYYLERACEVQVAALAGGRELVLPPEEVRLRTALQFDMSNPKVHPLHELAWRAAVRELQLEKTDCYR
jgi:ribulose-5-phosphate 4-epimerase/fuculose-1-phosphate aldolase